MIQKTVLSMAELQQELGISKTTAFQLVARSDFPSARLGRRIVVPVAALQEWLARGGTEPKNDGMV